MSKTIANRLHIETKSDIALYAGLLVSGSAVVALQIFFIITLSN